MDFYWLFIKLFIFVYNASLIYIHFLSWQSANTTMSKAQDD